MEDILFEQKGSLAIVTLNRPKALNALTLEMVEVYAPQLAAWAVDPSVKAVLIKGAGEKAFCAGGDVRAVWDAGKTFLAEGGYDPLTAQDESLPRRFFLEEYRLNQQIHRFPKPYIALLDGVTMGGGLGLSVHGSYRIATERCLSAMPETAIGLFPDIGGTLFLRQAPGLFGRYLALTGGRLKGWNDAIYAGFATHGMESTQITAFEDALCKVDLGTTSEEAHGGVQTVISEFQADVGPAALAAQQKEIDHCFGFNTVEEIVEALRASGSEWAKTALKTIGERSPTSVKLALQQMIQGQALAEIEDVLTMEFRMMQRCVAGHDFYEGIRAVLVDKDHAPKWQPDRLDAVSDEAIARYFEPLGDNDLRFS